MTTYPIALGIAEPGGVWRVETLTLQWESDDVPDRATLEREAIAAWTASNVRSEAVHLWLMDDDGWEEDADAIQDALRAAMTEVETGQYWPRRLTLGPGSIHTTSTPPTIEEDES